MNAREEAGNAGRRADRRSRNGNNALRRDPELQNPCYKEHLLSLKCLDSNQKDRDACDVYFENYKVCKKFWAGVQSERRVKGIKPYLPPPEERAKIKADFLSSKS